MKKLIALLAVTLPLVGQAQPPEGQDWWACQHVEAVGMRFDEGVTRPLFFEPDGPFVLVLSEDGKSLTNETGANAMGRLSATCDPSDNLILTCTSPYYSTLHFNKKLGYGAVVNMYGAVTKAVKPNPRNDSVLSYFECAKG